MAVFIVIALLTLGLGWREALIVAVAVPVVFGLTLTVNLLAGYTINRVTLFALIFSIGILVDDAIVVLENIYRRIEMGETALVAAYRGVREVGFAVIATTLALIAVFVPISFLEGDVGRLFSEFALTMAAAVLVAGFFGGSETGAYRLNRIRLRHRAEPRGEQRRRRHPR